MPKPIVIPKPTPTPTEIVTPGQPSEATKAKLQAAGAILQDEDILSALDHVESNRVAFASTAIVAGVYLLARKQTIKHGHWLPWVEKFGGKLAAKLATRCQFDGEKAARSIRAYCYLGAFFLADLDQGEFRGEMPDERVRLAVTADDVLALDASPQERRIAVFNTIERFVAGRSVRQMLADFRRAENAADDEERAARPAPRTARLLKEQAAYPQPAHQLAGEQLELWRDFARPLHALDTLLTDEGDIFQKTDRSFWQSIVESLEARLITAKARLKTIA